MNSSIRKILRLFILWLPRVEKLFGLSNFSYRSKHFTALTLLSCAIKIAFLVLYPFACFSLLGDFIMQDSGITLLARNITFVFNFLLLVFIFGSEILTSNQQIEEKLKSLFLNLIQRQNWKQNVLLLMRCSLKSAALLVGLVRTSSGKYTFGMKKTLTMGEKALLPFVFFPFVILVLISNRLYVANNIVRHCLARNAEEIKSWLVKMETKAELATISYQNLHEFFIGFNRANQINLLTFLTFSILNIAYQVKQIRSSFPTLIAIFCRLTFYVLIIRIRTL